MVAWLCDNFGFSRHLVVEDDKGGITHAELTRGNGMIMIGNTRDDDFGKLQKSVRALGGSTQSAYVIVDDVDAICTKAREAGAEIVMEPRDQEYGGRDFSCRDPEGQLWSFGTYDPWAFKK